MTEIQEPLHTWRGKTHEDWLFKHGALRPDALAIRVIPGPGDATLDARVAGAVHAFCWLPSGYRVIAEAHLHLALAAMQGYPERLEVRRAVGKAQPAERRTKKTTAPKDQDDNS